MLELRKLNDNDVVEQWKYITALPADENGFTNPYEGVSFEEYRGTVLPELMMHENPIDMPDWFVSATYYYLWDDDTRSFPRRKSESWIKPSGRPGAS